MRPKLAAQLKEVQGFLLGAVTGAFVGMLISYFFQPGLLRELMSLGEYLSKFRQIWSGDENIQAYHLAQTARFCVFLGAALGAFTGRFVANMLDGILEQRRKVGIAMTKGTVNPLKSPKSAKPPADSSEPGQYVVHGVDRESKMDTTWHVSADSEASARVKAELEGIIVTTVVKR
jgi:hypothetical protein